MPKLQGTAQDTGSFMLCEKRTNERKKEYHSEIELDPVQGRDK